MLLTTLSGKYKIGNTIVVNVGDRSVLVNSQPVRLRRQVFSALLLLMEQRLHEAAVPYDDFSKTLAEDKRLRGDVISNESIRGIVMELNKKLQPHLIAPVPGIGYKLDAEITPLEPRNSAIPPTAISEFSQITERLNSVIDNIPELIETSIMLALSGNFYDITDDPLKRTVLCDTDITDDNWHVPQTLPVAPPTPISLQSKDRDTFRTCIHNRGMSNRRGILPPIKANFRSHTDVWQENLTKSGGKRPAEAVFNGCEYRFLILAMWSCVIGR